METKLLYQPFDKIDADAVAVVLFEDETAPAELKFASAWLDELKASGEFTGKTGELAVLHQPAGSHGETRRCRRAEASAINSMLPPCAVPSDRGPHAQAERREEAGLVARMELTPKPPSKAPSSATSSPICTKPPATRNLSTPFTSSPPPMAAALDQAFERGKILAESQNFTRDLVNEPANIMTPTVLADRARAMAAEVGLECEVLDQDRMRQLGMGSLLGVAQGSAEPPALIIVRYKPAADAQDRRIISAWSARASPSTPAASPSSPPTAWRR